MSRTVTAMCHNRSMRRRQPVRAHLSLSRTESSSYGKQGGMDKRQQTISIRSVGTHGAWNGLL
jgi:hypothetical protein